jgi:hypothetical protein
MERSGMCLPRVCSLALSILINLPLAGWVLTLQDGSWELKLFAIPFAVSPLMAMALFCGRRGSFLSRTALFILLLSLIVKGVGATFAAIGLAATANSNTVFGGLGAIVYGFVCALFTVSALSDMWLFCVEIYRNPKREEGKRELVAANDFF